MKSRLGIRSWVCLALLAILAPFFTTCGGDSSPSVSCATITGTPWTPSIPGVSAANHNASITVSSSATMTATGTIVGLAQAAPAAVEIPLTIDMSSDLGPLGSLTLTATVSNYPSSLQGSAYPMLVSLTDGASNEYINLARAGTGGDCWQSGYYTCSGGICSVNPACSISWPSAYINRSHWEQHQAPNISAVNAPSVNVFPTCNYSGGSSSSQIDPACPFVSSPTWFTSGKLRTGTYTAKYVLIADSYPTVSGKTATLNVTVTKKTNPTSTVGGAVDLNVILVGDTNVQASRTAKGQQNLNTLVSNISGYFSQTGTGVKIGTVNSIEWACTAGGNTYAQANLSQLDQMLATGSTRAPASSAGKAINVFLVSSIVDDTNSVGSDFVVLGIDGAIGGPPINGTAVSGLTVSTFDQLDKYNPNCTATGVCPVTSQDADFYELGQVVTHEMGHYFGLNHLSEYDATEHDILHDTPYCTAKETVGGVQSITINSCLNQDTTVQSFSGKKCSDICTGYNSTSGSYCPTAQECEFNHVMWWTVKNFKAGTGAGDGNLFSTSSGAIINYSPLVQ